MSVLSMKDLMKLVAIFAGIVTFLMSVLTFVHAEMTIPKILHETARQIQEAIDHHLTLQMHPTMIGKDEFRVWSDGRDKIFAQFADQILRRLDTIETELRKK